MHYIGTYLRLKFTCVVSSNHSSKCTSSLNNPMLILPPQTSTLLTSALQTLLPSQSPSPTPTTSPSTPFRKQPWARQCKSTNKTLTTWLAVPSSAPPLASSRSSSKATTSRRQPLCHLASHVSQCSPTPRRSHKHVLSMQAQTTSRHMPSQPSNRAN